ncbi:hypothetical protein [Marinilactibacillus sp. Marseille-P9653]|uniref:hypothetical protein n=1 Tax=Marinilactibacillus sp. Marseille-P9653 TaxID=2866583 RepID=UPI001CE40951|nr:hypothetical protein [Marinilactibacillus sp. Marseille-P9653]
MKTGSKAFIIVMLSLFMAACTDQSAPEIAPGANGDAAEESTEETDATGTDEQMAALDVDLYNGDSQRAGNAIFDESDGNVMLTLNLEDVSAGEISIQIHSRGEATPPSFEDAGDDFQEFELPDLEVSEGGAVNQTFELEGVSLLPEAEGTLATEDGSSIIILNGSGSPIIGGVIFPPQ